MSVSAVVALSSPAGLAPFVGLIAGILTAKAVARVSIVEVGQLVAEHARVAGRQTLTGYEWAGGQPPPHS